MHPPIATGKNDHLPGLQSRRKSSFTEKEVLAENEASLQQHPEKQLGTFHTSALINSESDDFLCFKSQPAKFDQFLAKRNSNSSGSSETNSSIISFCSCQNFSPNPSLLDGTQCEILTVRSCQKEQHCLIPSSNICTSALSERKSDIWAKSQIHRNSKLSSSKVVLQDSFQIAKPTTDTLSDIETNTKVSQTKTSEREVLNVPRNLFVNNFDIFGKNNEYGNTSQVNNLQKLETIVNFPLSETSPLLTRIETTIVDPKRSIFLNKNSASLIFTKKDSRKNNFNSKAEVFNPNIGNNTEKNNNSCTKKISGSNQSIDNSNSKCKNPALVHRQSLQVNYFPVISRESSICHSANTTKRTNTASNNRRQHAYSWYAPVYSALEEEFEQDSRDSSPIHKVAETQQGLQEGNEFRETFSLLNPSDTAAFGSSPLHQSRILRQTSSTPDNNVAASKISNSYSGSHTQVHNESEGPHAISLLGGPLPRRKRFENFLKSLVGRKPSKETVARPSLLPSPEIKVSKSPSANSLSQVVDGPNEKITNSTASLNSVQQKLWNVIPLLKRESSVSSLNHEKVHHSGMRKCETVLALSRSTVSVEPIRPQNRLRTSVSTSNANCSRCSSLLSLAASGSRYSLNLANSGFVSVSNTTNCGSKCQSKQVHPTLQTGSNVSSSLESANCEENTNAKCGNGSEPSSNYNFEGAPHRTSSSLQLHTPSKTTPVAAMAVISQPSEIFRCKLCLADVETSAATTIEQCGCFFCTECMKTYVEFEISEGAYEISCPDAQCPQQGIISLTEMTALVSAEAMNKHERYRLNREIELDKTRTWCPRAGCETVCIIGPSPAIASSSADRVNLITQVFCVVRCPTCSEEFCSGCKKPWHASLTCEENSQRLGNEGQYALIGIPFDNDSIKYCPMCAVPIEKDEGCAQMMCKRCKHVFCWYCLASLDDDFLLRHYDKGPCKNKLGHSRASVVWHRAQVIGIFAGFGILLLVASPLLLLAAPCIICCKCSICSGSEKLEDHDADFDDAVALQR